MSCLLAGPAQADSASLYKIGAALESKGQALQAIEYYGRAYKADAKNLSALYAYVRVCSENDRSGDLVGPCNTLLAIDPACKRFANMYLFRAGAYQAAAGEEKAIADCNKALALGQKGGFGLYSCRANCYASLGKVKEALSDYNLAIAMCQDLKKPAYLFDRRARLLESGQQYALAINDWTYLIKNYPDNLYYFLNRAQDKILLGQYKDAMADYDRAIKINPRDDHPYLMRGKLRLKLGQYLAAADDFSSSIKVDEQPSWTIYKLRAEAYEKAGKPDLARADRLKAAKMEES